MTEVIPIKMDLGVCDLEEGDEDAALDEESSTLFSFRKHRTVIIYVSIAAVVLIAACLIFVFAADAVPALSFGKPKLDNYTVPISENAKADAEPAKVESKEETEVRERWGNAEVIAARREDELEAKASGEKLGRIQQYGDMTYYFMDSVAILNTSRYGKTRVVIALAFETNASTATTLLDNGSTIEDMLVAIVQSKDGLMLHEFVAPTTISNELRQNVEAAFPDAEITSVLVQEYVVF